MNSVITIDSYNMLYRVFPLKISWKLQILKNAAAYQLPGNRTCSTIIGLGLAPIQSFS